MNHPSSSESNLPIESISQFTPGAPPTAGMQRAGVSVFFLIVFLGCLAGLGPLSIDMYLPSFQTIAKEFGSTTEALSHSLAIYFFGLAIGQLFYGPAADRWGRKPPLYFGLATYIVASAGCAMAQGMESLIALRFLQALGGCAEMVVARAMVRDCFEERDAARVYSSLILVMGIAPILAPILGGWLVLHIGWRSIFWFLVLAGLLCLAAVSMLVGETHPPERRTRHNPLTTLGRYARLFKDREFMTYTLAASFALGGLFAYVAGSPFVFGDIYNITPDHFGFFFGANAFGLIAASQINGRLVRRHDPRKIVGISFKVAAAASLVLLCTTTFQLGGLPGFLIPLFVFLASLGFCLPTSAALAMAPHGDEAGNASAVLGFVQFTISGLGGMSVTAFSDGTTRPMALAIALGACGALAIYWIGHPRSSTPNVTADSSIA